MQAIRAWGVLALALTLLATACPASASTIDQQQLSWNEESGFLSPDVQDFAQTFTVGTSGQLTSISIVLDAGAGTPITLSLLSVSAGSPTTSVLATSVISNPPPSTPQWTTFEFANVFVYSGEVLAFQPSATISSGEHLGIDIAYNAADPYSGGELFINRGAGWNPFISELTGQGPIGGVDAAFQTQVSAVPWPRSIYVEVVFGFLGLGWMAYRRKSSGVRTD